VEKPLNTMGATNRPLTIAFDASPLITQRTGVAYYNQHLIENLARKYPKTKFIGFYFNLLGRHSNEHLPSAANIAYREIKFIPNKLVFQMQRFGVYPPLEIFLKDPVDFVLFGNFWGYPSLKSIPSAPVVHDLTYLDLPEYVSAKNRQDLAKLIPRQIRRSKFVVTVSEFSKQRLIDAYSLDPNSILVTPIPPSPPKIMSKEQASEDLKKLKLTKPFILFLGTVEPRKNIDNLIDAYAMLPEKLRKKYSLIIAGREGWYADGISEHLKRARHEGLDVRHIGYVTDEAKAALYQSASLFVTASHYEGFGMPVLEAMSYGTLCAVSDIPVFQEIARDAALYFNPENPKNISATIKVGLMDNKIRNQLSKKSAKLLGKYSWGKVASKLMNKIEMNLHNS
jgi:glycosyltransferase involved in cell wall biosynthesis